MGKDIKAKETDKASVEFSRDDLIFHVMALSAGINLLRREGLFGLTKELKKLQNNLEQAKTRWEF